MAGPQGRIAESDRRLEIRVSATRCQVVVIDDALQPRSLTSTRDHGSRLHPFRYPVAEVLDLGLRLWIGPTPGKGIGNPVDDVCQDIILFRIMVQLMEKTFPQLEGTEVAYAQGELP